MHCLFVTSNALKRVLKTKIKMFSKIFTLPIHIVAYGTAFGAVGVMSVGFLLKRIKADGLSNQPCYVSAVRYTKKHPGIIHLLGQPVHDKVVIKKRDIDLRFPEFFFFFF